MASGVGEAASVGEPLGSRGSGAIGGGGVGDVWEAARGCRSAGWRGTEVEWLQVRGLGWG